MRHAAQARANAVCVALSLATLGVSPAFAGPDPEPDGQSEASSDEPTADTADDAAVDTADDAAVHIIEIHGRAPARTTDEPGRARDHIDAQELERRQPRSTPEALLTTPGVSIQKTNHAGGSPIIRGLTGQKTVLLIDGFRLGTGIMRPGPSQYLNTIPVGMLDGIDVVRGTGSVLYGSDAIGGAVQLRTRSAAAYTERAHVSTRAATAERSLGGRAEFGGRLGPVSVRTGLSAGMFGNLRGAGPIAGAPTVPIYNGNEQLYTGYREISGDMRASVPVAGGGEVSAAAIAYHQFGAPRTDRCTAEECLVFDEQFYDMAYVRYRGRHGRLGLVDAGLALARTHERRSTTDHVGGAVERELDVVWSLSGIGRAVMPSWRLGGALVRVSAGFDMQAERLASRASVDVNGASTARARGKFLDGAHTGSAALYALADATVRDIVGVTAGARMSAALADIPDDPDSMAPGFKLRLAVPVASLGARLRIVGPLHAAVNVDQGFRAPNLYDLTAQTGGSGPGYQLPNPALSAETSLAAEVGLAWQQESVQISAFAYQMRIDDFIAREPTACPAELLDRCGDADNVYRAVNAESAMIRGVEMAALVRAGRLTVQGTATWTRGDRTLDAAGESEPLPKIPPIHGSLAVRRQWPAWFLEVVGRRAMAQTRLAPRDIDDARIPDGGTPGYSVLDARIGGYIHRRLRAVLTVENIFNAPYRVHGSGVDGAGFGAVLSLTGRLP